MQRGKKKEREETFCYWDGELLIETKYLVKEVGGRDFWFKISEKPCYLTEKLKKEEKKDGK